MKIFLSTPIAGFSSEVEYEEYRKQLMGLHEKLCKIYGKDSIFAAFANTSTFSDYDSPEVSAQNDIEAIKNCDLFIIFYPGKIATSALVELGIAVAEQKYIILVSPKLSTFPYMVQGLPAMYKKQVHWINTSDCDVLLEAISQIASQLAHDIQQ